MARSVIFNAAGVKIGFGTDLLGPLHAYQFREFLLRAEVLRRRDPRVRHLDRRGICGSSRVPSGFSRPARSPISSLSRAIPLENLGLLQEEGRYLSVILKAGALHKLEL